MIAITPTPETQTGKYLEQGFEVFFLRNDALELALVPALGAKIISLRNVVTGHEWMWHPPGGRKLFRNRLGDDFASSTMIGWDECIPTIAPCVWKRRQLPDHGEIWSVPWCIDLAAFCRGILKTSVTFAISPFHFERRIELRGNEIHLNYRLENVSNLAEEFLWAMHPLLPVRDGDQLELTAETRKYLAGEQWINDLKFKPEKPACAKVYAGPLREGQAGFVNSATRDRLRFEWDTKANNTLGLWLTRGGWNGYHHLVLEPINGAPDPLDVAAKTGRCGIVPPRETLFWNVKVTVSSEF
jgi:hypothetical protein